MYGQSFDEGALIRVWIPPMSTYTRVLCYLWNYHGDTRKLYLALRPKGCTHYLEIGSNQPVQATSRQMEHSLFVSNQYHMIYLYMTTRLGAVAFTVLWCEMSTGGYALTE